MIAGYPAQAGGPRRGGRGFRPAARAAAPPLAGLGTGKFPFPNPARIVGPLAGLTLGAWLAKIAWNYWFAPAVDGGLSIAEFTHCWTCDWPAPDRVFLDTTHSANCDGEPVACHATHLTGGQINPGVPLEENHEVAANVVAIYLYAENPNSPGRHVKQEHWVRDTAGATEIVDRPPRPAMPAPLPPRLARQWGQARALDPHVATRPGRSAPPVVALPVAQGGRDRAFPAEAGNGVREHVREAGNISTQAPSVQVTRNTLSRHAVRAHNPARAGELTFERKVAVKTVIDGLIIGRLFASLTESTDLINAFYNALPKRHRGRFVEGVPYSVQKLERIWEHRRSLDIEKALTNAAINELGDAIAAGAGKATAQVNALSPSPVGLQTGSYMTRQATQRLFR